MPIEAVYITNIGSSIWKLGKARNRGRFSSFQGTKRESRNICLEIWPVLFLNTARGIIPDSTWFVIAGDYHQYENVNSAFSHDHGINGWQDGENLGYDGKSD